jgi:hypothetical protein
MLSFITHNNPSSKAVVSGSDHGVLGTTALRKILMGKMRLGDRIL